MQGITRSELMPWAPDQSQGRILELERRLMGVPANQVPTHVAEIIASHQERIDDSGIVLYAGTNVMGPLAQRWLASTLGNRPSMGAPGSKYQTGVEDIEALEVLTTDLVRRAVRARYAEVRIQSGTLANLAVYYGLTSPGDTIAVLPEAAGGHASHHAYGVAGIRGLRIVDLPYDPNGFDVDLEQLPAFLRRHRPRLIVLGGSLMLFPHRIREVRRLADEVGSLILYDAAHVVGLIAGGCFQKPLAEGAHLMTFSTYKTFGGPPGGCVVTDDPDLARQVSAAVYPGMTANYDAARLTALAVAAAELLEFGEAYARDCRANAQALARRMAERGLPVVGSSRGYTASHQLALDADAWGGGDAAARRLAAGGIYLSGIGLPWQEAGEGSRGIRIGVQEVTRRGFGPGDMEQVGDWIADILHGKTDPGRVRTEVERFRQRFREIHYAFPETTVAKNRL